MSTPNNNQVLDITLNDNKYEIKVSLKENILQDYDEYYFSLEERETEKIIYISSSIIDKIDEYIIFKLSIPFHENSETFLESDIWDLYLNQRKGEDLKKNKVKSNYDNIRFLTILFPDLNRMFYPYTSNKGKISFRLNEYFLYSKIDTVSLEKNEFSFSGYFNFPPLYKSNEYELSDLKLIVIYNDENEYEVPVERFSRKDIYDKYDGNEELLGCGIKGQFNFSNYFNMEKTVFLKFYLQMTYKHHGEFETIRSTRIRLDHNSKEFPIKRIIPHDNKKMKVIVKPTKESSYLSFQIARYNFKSEVVKNTKSVWLKIRRGEKLKYLYKYAFYMLGKLPARKKSVMFESFLGKQYSDSPRAIYEYMLKEYPEYNMYWSVDRRHLKYFEDKNVNYVRRFSIKWLLVMPRAGYWVSNSRLPLWIPKPNHTTYLQTWHGTPLKRLATDMDEVHMPGTNTTKYKTNFLKATNKWDYLVSPNAYSTEIFRRAFQFNKTMIESGYPRNDFLINSNNEETIQQIKKNSNLPTDKKVILYAPTWRDNQFYGRGKYKFNLEMDLDKLRDELGEDYIILLRLHYLVAENLDLTEYEGFVYDFSSHEDIRELYLISDMLITDYSSVFFDYANLKRPMMFFVYDIDDYRDNLRGFYFDFEKKAPGPLVKTTEGLLSEIKQIEQNGFIPSETTEAFYNKFCYLEDGNASKRVVNEVFDSN
ncbi:CDP-glycerol glycerophosphotransferase family protein [Virgibacillus litoralis]|uniref:CDP-glycerol glycerophosphotransferase n=1 Tax=Virgibacillus litoralis TaxID=578221 RepID=A0ABS4HI38_9BACI|nr:CDP-glycerol glycerophosphotransferase family protein [Virgibacillus litoralis]MBP1950586.1 CDP-glycerol glycerophosphotransferase [Virgibacillus litoralis]